jgi:hypothetical protein
MNPREIGLEGLKWIDLAQNMGLWLVLLNGSEPCGPTKGREFLG